MMVYVMPPAEKVYVMHKLPKYAELSILSFSDVRGHVFDHKPPWCWANGHGQCYLEQQKLCINPPLSEEPTALGGFFKMVIEGRYKVYGIDF